MPLYLFSVRKNTGIVRGVKKALLGRKDADLPAVSKNSKDIGIMKKHLKGEMQMAAREAVETGHINIEFKYKVSGFKEWCVHGISVEEYFDFSMLEEGERLRADSIPLYNQLIEYLFDERRPISQIFISIEDKIKNEKLQFSQTFWNSGQNSILERVDTAAGVRSYQEFIIETLIPTEITGNTEKDYEIIRFSPKEDGVKCWYHGVIHENADGSQRQLYMEYENNL